MLNHVKPVIFPYFHIFAPEQPPDSLPGKCGIWQQSPVLWAWSRRRSSHCWIRMVQVHHHLQQRSSWITDHNSTTSRKLWISLNACLILFMVLQVHGGTLGPPAKAKLGNLPLPCDSWAVLQGDLMWRINFRGCTSIYRCFDVYQGCRIFHDP